MERGMTEKVQGTPPETPSEGLCPSELPSDGRMMLAQSPDTRGTTGRSEVGPFLSRKAIATLAP